MLELIGIIVLLLIGGYVSFFGLFCIIGSNFTGVKHSKLLGTIIFFAGIAIIVSTLYNNVKIV